MLRLHIELRSEGKRVCGQIRDEQGNSSCFAGWLDLLTQLEKARGESAARDATAGLSARQQEDDHVNA